MKVVALLFGTFVAQLAGAVAYWRVRFSKTSAPRPEWLAALSSGFATTVVASVAYAAFRVHDMLGEYGSTWAASVFLGLCMGIGQGVFLRGRLLQPPHKGLGGGR